MGWKDDPVVKAKRPRWADDPEVGARNKGTGIGAVDQTLSSVNEFLLGVPEGLYNLGAAVTDPVMGKVFGKDALAAAQQQRRGALDTVSRAVSSRTAPGARTAGQIASTLPLAKLKIAGKAAQLAPRAAAIGTRAFQGAMGGAAVRGEGDSVGQNVLIGAGSNVLLPPILGAAISKIGTSRPVQWAADRVAPAASRIVGTIDGIAETAYGAIAPRVGLKALPRVQPRLSTGASAAQPIKEALGRAAQARLDNFRKAGVKNPTTGMVTRDPRAWTFERETAKAAGVGDDLLASFNQVSDDLDAAATKMVARRGGVADPETVGQGVQKVLDIKRGEMQRTTGALYEKVRAEKGDVAAGTLQNLMDVMDDPDLLDNPSFDAMRDGVMRRLQRFGMAGQSGMIRNGAVATVSQAEALRKFIGSLGDGKDPATRMMRGRMIDALDDSVVDAVGDDAFKAARASARARFEEFGKTFAGRLADNGIAPEQVVSRIMQKGVRNSDVRALKESFFNGTPEQVARGSEAWNKLGGSALSDFFEQGRLADGTLSGAKLDRAFARDAAKLKELLTPEEFDQLRAIVSSAHNASTAVPFSAVNNSNSSSAIANLFAPEASGAPVGRQVVKNLLQHAGAFAAGGPVANVGLAVAKSAASDLAAQKAAKAALDRVNLAKSPEAAATALKAMQAKASRNAAFRAAVKRWQDGGFYTPFSGGPGAGR